MTSPDSSRLAAHVLLDVVSAYSEDDADEANERAMEIAIARLHDVGCVTATFDDETASAIIDVSALAGGTVTLLYSLVERVAMATGLAREVVISQTREVLDRAL
jgi:hypothetical protein